jgi:hypothetical protein
MSQASNSHASANTQDSAQDPAPKRGTPSNKVESTTLGSKKRDIKAQEKGVPEQKRRELPPRTKRGAKMKELLARAKEEQDLFWLSMGFCSSDGERDDDFEQESSSLESEISENE